MGKHGLTAHCVHIEKSSRRKALRGPSKKTISLGGTHCPKAGDISTALAMVASAAICFVEGNPTMESSSGEIPDFIYRGARNAHRQWWTWAGPESVLRPGAESVHLCLHSPSFLSLWKLQRLPRRLMSSPKPYGTGNNLSPWANGTDFNVGVWKCEFVCSHPHKARWCQLS